jgi:hypothetical protein
MSIDTRTVTTGPRRGTSSTVPWTTVLPLAAVMAFADAFWVTTVRGALNAVDPAVTPLASWLRVSVLSLPLFTVAVLAAVTLILRRHGTGPLTARATATTTLLVAGAGSLVGITWLAATVGYDASLPAVAPGPVVMTRALAYGSAALLVSNVVLVAWLVAMRGGRIDLAAGSRRMPPGAWEGRLLPSGRLGDLRLLLVVALLGNLALHATVAPEHLGSWPGALLPLVSLIAAVLAVAALVLGSHANSGLALALALALPAVVVVWVTAQRLGLPYTAAEGGPQPVALADLAGLALDAVLLILAWRLLRRPDRPHPARPALSAHARWLAVLSLVALTALGFAGNGAGWFNDYGGSGTRPTARVPHSTPVHR